MDSNQALAQLQQAQASSQNPNDILTNQRQTMGVNQAQETTRGLRGALDSTTKLLKSVAPSVMGRTANSLVTSAQAGRIIQNESAPINQKITDQGGQLSDAVRTEGELNQKAQEAASGIYQGQQDNKSYLQNLYDTLYGREKDQRDYAFQQRQYADSLKGGSSGGGRGGSGGSGGSGGKSATPPATYQVRKDGGYNFQNAKGQPISARRYAQITGTDFNTLLKKMASGGDKGAADVLKNGGSAKSYKALTWD